jgi:hypothetical protein
MLNEQIGEFHFNFFILILLSYSIGNYIFYKDVFKKDTWAKLNIIFFGILSIIPYMKPITYFIDLMKDFEINLKPVNDIYFSFYNDYQRQNPFTKREGMYFYVNELKKRGYISNFIYDILIKNIKKINVMEIYYNTSINPTLKEAQYTLSRAKSRYQIRNFSRRKNYHEKNKNKNKIEEDEEEKEKKSLNNLCDDENSEKDYDFKIEEDKKILEKKNSDNDISSSIKNRKSCIPKSININKLIKILSDEDITEKNNLLVKQYNNPLLLSIGLGIQNLAFSDYNKNKFKSFNQKNNYAHFTINEIDDDED